jgi:cytochrome c-type biogenesis protein CcmF
MFPVITRAFAEREVVLDASFFNQLSVPLFLAIISLMSISPLLRERPVGVKNWVKSLALPILLALVAAACTYVTTRAGVTTIFAFALAAFGFGTHLPSLLSPRSRRRWGGALVHLGVLVVLVGVTGSSVFIDDVLITVNPEDQIILGDYVLEYDGLRARYGSDRYTVETTLAIMKGEGKRGEITSVKTFWEGRTQPSTQVGIFSTFKEDVYLNLAGWENQTAQLHLIRFALVSWIWVGSWIMYIGTLVILLGGMSLDIKGKQVRLWAR